MMRATDMLVVIDVQNDFCPGGALAVPGGDEVVPVINRLAADFAHMILTQDWHTPGHSSFASAHAGRKPFDTVEVDYGPQVLWPDHCVQDTQGAAFHRDLDLRRAELVVRKGFRPKVDSYSAFFENDKRTPTGLGGYLRERGFQRLFMVGLATDFCVRFSAEDARRLGFETVVLEDASRGIGANGSLEAAADSFRQTGVRLVASAMLKQEAT